MATETQFLLIGGAGDNVWNQKLHEVLSPLGALGVCREGDAIHRVLENDYALVIIDALGVRNVPLLVSRIRSQRPQTKVVVASAALDWQHARAAFHAGAADYIHKTHDTSDLRRHIDRVLARPQPPWPR